MAKEATAPATANSSPRQVITIHVSDQGDIQKVDPDPFVISKEAQEEVQWVIDKAKHSFTVEFARETGSPFYESQFNSQFSASGLVRREILPDPRRYYKYTVRTERDDKDPGGYIK